jgi:hypothetical protein
VSTPFSGTIADRIPVLGQGSFHAACRLEPTGVFKLMIDIIKNIPAARQRTRCRRQARG